MADKARVLLVGGMDYNVPKELKEVFDVVRHVTQGSKFQTLPKVDYVLVVTEWAGHNLVEAVKAKSSGPIIPLPRGGWTAIKSDLQARSILPPDVSEEKPEAKPVEDKPPAESLFSSMSESEVWKKYGAAIIEAAQTTLKPKEVLLEDHVLEALSLSGVPKDDCKAFLPKLQMKGILDPVSGGKWRLMAAPGVDFDNDRVKVEGEKRDEVAEVNVAVKTNRRQVRSPTLVGMIAGLGNGPYTSKRGIFEAMRKHVEFDALSDWQVMKYIDRAIEAKIIDDSRKDLYINTDYGVKLTLKKALEEELKSPEETMKEATKATPLFEMFQAPVVPKKEFGRTEAEKAWCFVVEGVKKERERLANVLAHCRIEWMGDNKVLVVFLPAVLATWQKFVESTENWGLVSKHVQERFTKSTVIRFMLDNGLRV